MKRLIAIAAPALLLAAAAAAQDPPPFQIKTMAIKGGVMGRTVKGAPYSGTEVNETNQVLADGTRIHNETQTQVWRDSEGRVRRETGNDVMIYDPVAGASYSINTKNQTARKLPLGTYMFTSVPDGSRSNVAWFRFSTSDGAHGDAEAAAASAYKTAYAQMKVRDAAGSKEQDLAELKRNVEISTMETSRTLAMSAATGKLAANNVQRSLGRRMMEGVNADGTGETSTIEAGTIGNDRPIQSSSERWYSPDLQTAMMSRHSDPRTGEETFKLINVSRTEPPPYLFQVPAGYQLIQ